VALSGNHCVVMQLNSSFSFCTDCFARLTNEDSGEDENCEHKASKNEEIVSEKFNIMEKNYDI
jgi:hypothetical protein